MIGGMSREALVELARRLGRDPDELVEWWAERAAIREVDGGQPRDAAEAGALDDLRTALGERRGPLRAEGATVGSSAARKS